MIYDRTILDVSNAKKIISKFQSLADWSSITEAEINTLERGTYTRISLNRVEEKVAELCRSFRDIGYSFIDTETTTDWDNTKYFNKSQHKRFFSNIAYLYNLFPLPSDTPNPPYFSSSGEYVYGNITYALANDAEKILVDIEKLIDLLKKSWYYSGEIYSGEV